MLKDNKLSKAKRGASNPAWKGDTVGYSGLHTWIRARYIKPDLCERCEQSPPRDLANKSGDYLRDLSDWWYLCRRCHMELDGRAEQARQFQLSRKVDIPPCKHCGRVFYRRSGQRIAQFCSRKCFNEFKLARSPLIVCPSCGADIRALSPEGNHRKFCDRACFNAFRRKQ